MDWEQAEELMDSVEYESRPKGALLKALTILSKYDDDLDLVAEHDEVWTGHDIEIEKVSKDDLRQLAKLGWSIQSDIPAFYKMV